MNLKTCQNLRRTCHDKIGPNRYDLCNGCNWSMTLEALRRCVRDMQAGRGYAESDLSILINYFDNGESKWPEVLLAFDDAIENDRRPALWQTALALDEYLIKLAPDGVRDNQPSVSDILNLPF